MYWLETSGDPQNTEFSTCSRIDISSRTGNGDAMAINITRRGVLWLGLYCDIRCEFCYDNLLTVSQKRWVALPDLKLALAKFRRFYQNEFVDFMGGEPTIHPDVLAAIEYSSEIGLKPTVVTHGMRLANLEFIRKFKEAGVHDFLVSVHGLGDTARVIHGRGVDNSQLQMAALQNMCDLDIPFRFNVTVVRENLNQLTGIARLAISKGARVVNFLTFNPYFEWDAGVDIPFQVSHTEASVELAKAIDILTVGGIEANVRYLPICQLPGHENHIFTGMQLPFDEHEWDYNSWYDRGHPGRPSLGWYLAAAEDQRNRHNYVQPSPCSNCAVRAICDGVHEQYLARFGFGELRPFDGGLISDPRHFIAEQPNLYHEQTGTTCVTDEFSAAPLAATQFQAGMNNRAGISTVVDGQGLRDGGDS